MSNPLDKFINEILKEEFHELPRWVDADIFYEDKAEELKELIIDNYEKGELSLSYVDLFSFVCPLVSDKVDLGASGSMWGKYDEQYDFPDELIKYLEETENAN
jgi:hypothetical protein